MSKAIMRGARTIAPPRSVAVADSQLDSDEPGAGTSYSGMSDLADPLREPEISADHESAYQALGTPRELGQWTSWTPSCLDEATMKSRSAPRSASMTWST